MAIEHLLVRYGVLAVLVGAGLEGEAVVLTGGVLARAGLIPLGPACIAAAVGSCVVDQLWFLAGRRMRGHPWLRRLTGRPAYVQAQSVLERHPTGFILAFRFIYGLRTVSPIAIGASRVPARRFVPLNVIAAAVWGPCFTLLGYAAGRAVLPLMTRLAHLGAAAALAAGAIALSILAWRRRSRQLR